MDIKKDEKVTVILDKEGKIEQALFYNTDGTIWREVDIDIINERLVRLAIQNGMSLKELKSDSKLYSVEYAKDSSKSDDEEIEIELEEDEYDEEGLEEDPEDELTDEEIDALIGEAMTSKSKKGKKAKKAKKTTKEKTPKKKKGFVKRLIAGITLVAVLATGGYHLNKHTSLFKGKKAWFSSKPDKTIEMQVTDTDAPKSDYEQEMVEVIEREEESNKIISQVVEDKTEDIQFNDYMQALDDVSMTANSSMFEVSEFINGRDIAGTAYYKNFETLFTNPSDIAAVKYFSDYRNETVRNAFENRDRDATVSSLRSFYTGYTEFVAVGRTYSFNYRGKDYDVAFKDLSPMAQATILNLGFAMFTVNSDYTYYNENDNTTYPKLDTIELSSQLYNDTLVSIENKGFSK